jgi:colicin import membrane protein
MTKKQGSYPLALTLAILLHVALFAFLFFHFALPTADTASTSPVNIVQASIVTANNLESQPPPKPDQEQAEKAQQAAEQAKREAEQQLALQRRQQEEQAQQQAEQQQKAEKQKQLAEQQRLEQQKIAQQKQAAAAKQQAIALAKQQKEAQQQLMMKQLQTEQQQLLQKQMAQEQRQLHAQAASRQQQGVIDKYKTMIVHAIQQNWLVPDNVDKNLVCQLLVQVGPGGTVLSVQVVRSSGNPALDRSAQAAVYKTSPLPVPEDPALFDRFRSLRLTVRPENIISG